MGDINKQRFFAFVAPTTRWRESLTSNHEKLFSKVLDKIGIPYKSQEPVDDRYILDFALYHQGVYLNIEIDGESHKEKKQIKADRVRDKYLWNNGWRVLRITNQEVEEINTEKMVYYKYLISELLNYKED